MFLMLHEVKAKRIDRVTKAISLAGTRQKKVEVTAVKKNRIYYRDANPPEIKNPRRTEAARQINSGLF